MKNSSFPSYLLVLILFIAIVNGLANEFSWYWRVAWLDIPMHLLGGFWVASVALWFISRYGKTGFRKVSKTTYLLSLFAVLTIGVLWEIFEFKVDTLVNFSEKNSAMDTASDLFFDILGGVIAIAYFGLKNKNE